MTLFRKTLLIVGVLLVGLVGLIAVSARLLVLASFAELEERDVHRNLERVASAIADEAEVLKNNAHNSSHWDKAYAFVRSGDLEFIRTDVGTGRNGDMWARRLQLLAYFDTERRLVFGEGFDLDAGQETAIPAGVQDLFASHRALVPATLDDQPTGLVQLPDGPMLVSAAPIVRSDGSGPVRGTMVIGRYLNAVEARRLGERTHLDVSVRGFAERDAAQVARAIPIPDDHWLAWQPLDDRSSTGFLVLRDLLGQPSVVVEVQLPRTIHGLGLRTIAYMFAAVVVVGFAGGVVILWLLHRSVLSRLTSLGAQVTEIGRRQDLPHRVEIDGTDEIGMLGLEINSMLAAIDHATQAATDANRAKSEFLANMSHELRTPLNAILGYSELIAEELGDAVDGHAGALADLARIRSAGGHLLSLVDDVLDLSKVEAGRLEVSSDPVDVGPVVADVVKTCAPLAHKHGTRLDVASDGDTAVALCDGMRLRQVVFNLVSNACKFTSGGAVTVHVGHESRDGREWIRIDVRDTGIGMSPDAITRLFRPFSQGDPSTTRRYGGTGLGLALSRRLCRLMMGDIDVASTPGAGSTFTVRLPAATSKSYPTAA
ncbi:MAG: ATP-binding protein [Vicinamibacterales bacterium]